MVDAVLEQQLECRVRFGLREGAERRGAEDVRVLSWPVLPNAAFAITS